MPQFANELNKLDRGQIVFHDFVGKDKESAALLVEPKADIGFGQLGIFPSWSFTVPDEAPKARILRHLSLLILALGIV